jgi:hypothetical protein
MKYIIGEDRMSEIIHRVLVMEFKGFDDIYYDWADFNCGMGVCCDPYAIGFVLPDSEYNDYLFKLVNSKYYDDDGDYPSELKGDLPEPCHNPPNINNKEFDTIILSDEMYERLESLFGSVDVWSVPLLTIINGVFNTNALSYTHSFR